MMQHTKDFLAQELRKAGLNAMADRAAEGYYHDYLSPLDFPEMQLDHDLVAAGTPEALELRERHHNGEFDANKEESDDWAKSEEGQDALRRLSPGVRQAMGFPEPADEPETDLGSCCNCGSMENVRTVMMLKIRAPVPGSGWGCAICRLPSDGALAVLCDDCTNTMQDDGLKQVCVGFPYKNERMPLDQLNTEKFDHDPNIEH